jgi:hypothetical protein
MVLISLLGRAPLAEFAYKDRDHIIWRIALERERETLFASNRPRERKGIHLNLCLDEWPERNKATTHAHVTDCFKRETL